MCDLFISLNSCFLTFYCIKRTAERVKNKLQSLHLLSLRPSADSKRLSIHISQPSLKTILTEIKITILKRHVPVVRYIEYVSKNSRHNTYSTIIKSRKNILLEIQNKITIWQLHPYWLKPKLTIIPEQPKEKKPG